MIEYSYLIYTQINVKYPILEILLFNDYMGFKILRKFKNTKTGTLVNIGTLDIDNEGL